MTVSMHIPLGVGIVIKIGIQDVVEEYKMFEGHEEDILSMDVYMKKSILATGDYEGRICIWNINSGEKKFSLFHRSDRQVLKHCFQTVSFLQSIHSYRQHGHIL